MQPEIEAAATSATSPPPVGGLSTNPTDGTTPPSATSAGLPDVTHPPLANRVTGFALHNLAPSGEEPLWEAVITFDQGPRLLRLVQDTTPGDFAQEIIILVATAQQELPQFRLAQLDQIAARQALPSRPTPPLPAATPPPAAKHGKRGGKSQAAPTAPAAPAAVAPNLPPASASQPVTVSPPTESSVIAATQQGTLF